MKYIECPEEYNPKNDNEKSLFMAGGITGCDDWQSDFVELLREENLVLLNPRRKIFPEGDQEFQINWEFKHLNKADAISFWFPKETLCPITLYELGRALSSDKPVFVGVDPEYKRRKDVELQTKLVRKDLQIVYSLDDLVNQIKSWNYIKKLNL